MNYLHTLVRTLLITSASCYFIACNSEPVAPPQTVSFSKDIIPIFIQNCNFPTCHNSFDKKSGLDLTSWHSLMIKGSDFGAEVIPYNAKWSLLVWHINNDTTTAPVALPHMPKPFPPYTNGLPLPQNLVKLMMQWIDEGAKNNYGEVAYSNVTRKAFITNQASDLIAVINLENNFLIRLIRVGTGGNTLAAPHHVEVDRQGNYFYTILISTGYVEKFDAKTYQKISSMPIVSKPGHIVITPDGLRGYVTNFDVSGLERFIKCFDTQNMTVIDTISDITMNATHGARITNDGEYVLTVSQVGEFIQIIRTSDNEIEETIPVANNVPPNGNGTGLYKPIAISVSPDDKYAFISCIASNEVRVLDLQLRTIIKQIPVALYPYQSDCSPDGRWCYVANRNTNSVSVIDIQTLTVVKTIPNVGVEPHGVAFTPDGNFAYITCESTSGSAVHHPVTGSVKPGTTAVIDVKKGHVKIKNIVMASFPAGISITK